MGVRGEGWVGEGRVGVRGKGECERGRVGVRGKGGWRGEGEVVERVCVYRSLDVDMCYSLLTFLLPRP